MSSFTIFSIASETRFMRTSELTETPEVNNMTSIPAFGYL